MAQVMERLRERARQVGQRIVLAEPDDPRVLEAAGRIAGEGLARVVLIGERAGRLAGDGISWVDPAEPERAARFAQRLYELRGPKGLSEEEARRLAVQPLFCAALMVAAGEADGAVAGSIATTADVIRAGLWGVGAEDARPLVSSFFLMQLPDGRTVTFADCAVVPQPDAGQLARIAVTSARNHLRLTGETPRVAMLSFSTLGSARHPDVDRVREATRLARSEASELLVDGELQFDAAFDRETGARKAPGSPVAGQANVFVFPDLDAGNIGYKIAQRIGGAGAIGPIVQGLRRPFMDLSRGCSVDDIVNVATIAAVMGGPEVS